MFVCHGNICRSTMAEFVMKHLVKTSNLEENFIIESSATSREEIGSDTHHGTKAKLKEMNIPFSRRKAHQLTAHDCEEFDFIIGMDYENIRNIKRIAEEKNFKKVHLLLEYADSSYSGDVTSFGNIVKAIADPWYTGNFDATYNDVLAGCTGLLKYLKEFYNL